MKFNCVMQINTLLLFQQNNVLQVLKSASKINKLKNVIACVCRDQNESGKRK